MDSGGIDPFILNLNTCWRPIVSFTSRLCKPEAKCSQHSLDTRTDGPQSRSGRFEEEKRSLPFDHPAV
jgi:hypothetical protein